MTRTAGVKFVAGHPLVKVLVDAMREQGMTVVELEVIAGVGHTSLYNWTRGHSPNLKGLEACLNAVGLELTAVAK